MTWQQYEFDKPTVCIVWPMRESWPKCLTDTRNRYVYSILIFLTTFLEIFLLMDFEKYHCQIFENWETL